MRLDAQLDAGSEEALVSAKVNAHALRHERVGLPMTRASALGSNFEKHEGGR
jgi:hypothetical protein